MANCQGCNCYLDEDAMPLCATCEHERRSEAAKKAAETRAENREQEEGERR